MMAIGAEPHVNTCYKHFYYFVTEFHLLHEKEFEQLKEMTRYYFNCQADRFLLILLRVVYKITICITISLQFIITVYSLFQCMYRRFWIPSRDSLSLVIPINMTLDH